MNLPNNEYMTRTKHEEASEAARAQEEKGLANSADAVKEKAQGANLAAAQGAVSNAVPSTAPDANQGTAETRSACETVKLTRLTSKGG